MVAFWSAIVRSVRALIPHASGNRARHDTTCSVCMFVFKLTDKRAGVVSGPPRFCTIVSLL